MLLLPVVDVFFGAVLVDAGLTWVLLLDTTGFLSSESDSVAQYSSSTSSRSKESLLRNFLIRCKMGHLLLYPFSSLIVWNTLRVYVTTLKGQGDRHKYCTLLGRTFFTRFFSLGGTDGFDSSFSLPLSAPDWSSVIERMSMSDNIKSARRFRWT